MIPPWYRLKGSYEMGDRVNIVVRCKSQDHQVFLYGHWSGFDAPAIVAKALARKQRWDDASYLTRIIFDTMSDGQHGGETGFGISSSCDDNEYPFIIVDCDDRAVLLEDGFDCTRGPRTRVYSFEDYAALENPSWDSFNAKEGHAA
jgi:hypothetical protein